MIDASSVGCSKCIVKYKKTDLFFIMKWRKRQKKQTHEHELTFSLLIFLFFVGHDDSRRCAALSLPAEDFPVTDDSPTSLRNFLLPVCELCVLGK